MIPSDAIEEGRRRVPTRSRAVFDVRDGVLIGVSDLGAIAVGMDRVLLGADSRLHPAHAEALPGRGWYWPSGWPTPNVEFPCSCGGAMPLDVVIEHLARHDDWPSERVVKWLRWLGS